MKSLKNCSSGMTLTETLVGVAITSVVSVFAMNLITEYTRRAWEGETKAGVTAEMEAASGRIKKTLPQFVVSVTDNNGTTAPGSNFWKCTASACSMSVNYKFTNMDGVPDSAALNPMRADCVAIADTALAPAAVGLHSKSRISAAGSGCLSCPVGQAPQLTVNLYDFNPTTGVPTIVGTTKFPYAVGNMAKQSALAMGVCLTAAPYSYRFKIDSLTRYDRWEVTLIPVYSRRAPTSGMTDSEIGSNLVAAPDKILITPPRRFAPGFLYTPYR